MGRGQEVTVTNDGATILKSLYVDNPAAKVLVGKVFWSACIFHLWPNVENHPAMISRYLSDDAKKLLEG